MKALRPLSVIGVLFRLISAATRFWPLALIALFLASPVGPHLLWSYEYRYGARPYYAAPRERIYARCTYVGSRGFVTPDLAPNCPVFAFLDSRHWRTR